MAFSHFSEVTGLLTAIRTALEAIGDPTGLKELKKQCSRLYVMGRIRALFRNPY